MLTTQEEKQKNYRLIQTRKAYILLKEEDKKIFFKKIHAKDPSLITDLRDKTPLIQGFREEAIARRDQFDDQFKKKLDECIVSPENEGPFHNFVLVFFQECHPNFFDLLKADTNALLTEQTFKEIIDKQRKENSFTDLFVAAFTEIFKGTFSSEQELMKANLEKQRRELNECAAVIAVVADSIKIAKILDVEPIKNVLDNAKNTAEAFRKVIQESAITYGVKKREWNDTKELDELMNNLSEKILAQEEPQKKMRRFLSELAEIIEKMEIVHRPKARIEILDQLRLKTVEELRNASRGGQPKRIDGPESPQQWIEEVMACDHLKKASSQNKLKSDGYVNLAEFIEEADESWIGVQTAGRVEQIKEGDKEIPQPKNKTELSGENLKIKEGDPTLKPKKEIISESNKTGNVDIPIEPAEVSPTTITISGNTGNVKLKDEKTGKVGSQKEEIALGQGDQTSPSETERTVGVVQSPSKASKEEVSELSELSEKLFWDLLDQRKISTAYYLSKYTEKIPGLNTSPLPSWLLESLILAPYAESNQTEITYNHLNECFKNYSELQFFSDKADYRNRCNRLLLMAASLQPALTVPEIDATRILENLHLGETYLKNLVDSVINFAKKGMPISAEFLTGALSEMEWESKLDGVSKRAKKWWESIPLHRFSYITAHQIWKELMSSGGVINNLVQPVIKKDRECLLSLQNLVNKIDFDHEINTITKKKSAIEGQARKKLIGQANEARGFTLEWIGILKTRPSKVRGYGYDHIAELLREFEKNWPGVQTELSENAPNGNGFEYGVAVKLVTDSIENCHDLLKGRKGKIAVKPITPKLILAGDLLFMPSLRLDKDWDVKVGSEAETAPEKAVRAILSAFKKGPLDVEKSFDQQCEKCDHRSTQGIITISRLRGYKNEELLQNLEERRDASLLRCTAKLDELLNKINDELADSLSKGTINEVEREGYSDTIKNIKDRSEKKEIETFENEKQILDQIRKKLSVDREKKIQNAYLRLAEMEPKPNEEERNLIKMALDKRDVYVAHLYMDKVVNKEKFKKENEKTENENQFQKFFVSKSENGILESTFLTLYRWLEKNTRDEENISKKVERKEEFGGLNFHDVTETQCEDYAKVITAWFRTKRKNEPNIHEIETILNGLGWNISPNGVTPVSEGNKKALEVTSEQITVNDCPIAYYGSEAVESHGFRANGKYRIYCIFGKKNEDDLFDYLPKGQGYKGEIIFYFGRMSQEIREDFAFLCKEKHRTVIVIDDILLVYLSSVKKDIKLHSLFDCTLPFTYLLPYYTPGSLLPEEMFFGRGREIDAIETISNQSSCLVYGGRQTGKTVLLKHISRRQDEPKSNSFAIYADLKPYSLRSTTSLGIELWAILAEEIYNKNKQRKHKQRGPFLDQPLKEVTFKNFEEQIKEWLGKNPERRILLLLDEADEFLKADSKVGKGHEAFQLCSQINGLMVRTDRKFKVVFAGLHNVQRSTRVANNPLTHYGEPICIGPLLTGNAASDLIEKPLASLGITFKERELVSRILAQTCYYPSLIQFYCRSLLNHINERSKTQRTYPCQITSDDINEVYESSNLRTKLKDFFRLTLDLDKRFQIITYVLALLSDDYSNTFISIKDIYDWTIDLWDKGFLEYNAEGITPARYITYDAFRDLLEEMKGLGIVQIVETLDREKRYKLRSPLIRELLGTNKEIEEVLYKEVPTWDYFADDSPETFHRVLDHKESRRVPLDVAQENYFRANKDEVFIIIGTSAAGMDDFFKTFKSFPDLESEYYNGTFDSFAKTLSTFKSHMKPGKKLLVVSHEKTLWDNTWIDVATKEIMGLAKTNKNMAVVFVSNPMQLWENGHLWKDSEIVRTIQLQAWNKKMVQTWLEDSSLGGQNSNTGIIYKETGNWPYLLYKLASLKIKGSLDEKIPGLLVKWLGESNFSSETIKAFGLNVSKPLLLMKYMANHEMPLTEDDLVQLTSLEEGRDVSNEEVNRVICWADRLGLFVRQKNNKWILDPCVQIILKTLNSMLL